MTPPPPSTLAASAPAPPPPRPHPPIEPRAEGGWQSEVHGGRAATRRRYAVIIVHYRTPGMLADCLETLELEAGDEVVIVDNASGEEAVRTIEPLAARPGVTLIKSAENLGFAGGNNVGLRYVRETGGAAYYILLNSDTLVRPGALETLRRFLESRPEAACVGPRLEYPDGTPQLSAFGDPTPLGELIRGSNIGFVARLLKRWEVYGQIRDQPHRADWIAGACIMMREEVLERVGLLDDGYFMYYEEVDFLRRARRSGLETWYEPAARVVHLVGASSGITVNSERKRLPDYWYESRHRYFRKHFGYVGMLAADGLWLLGHLMMRVRRMLTGVSHSAVAKWETRDLLRHLARQLARPGAVTGSSGGTTAGECRGRSVVKGEGT